MNSLIYFTFFLTICFGTVVADGYGGGLDLKTLIYKLPNRTALCEVLNGTCVAPGDCAVFPNYGYGGGGHGGSYGKSEGFQRFDCNLTTICCFSIHRFLHLSGHSGGGYGGHSGGHSQGGYGGGGGGGGGHGGGGYKKKEELSFKSIVHKVFNRTALCEVLNGTCVSPGDCAVFGYGYGQNSARFDCNLTTICCFPLHTFHHGGFMSFGSHSGYGGQNNGHGGHSGGYGGQNNGHGGHSGGYGDQNNGHGGYGGQNNGYGNQNKGYGSRNSGYGGGNGGHGGGYGGNRRGGQRSRGYSRSYGDYDYGYGSQGGYGYQPRRRGMRLSGGYSYYDDHGGGSYDYYSA